jgi:hypothetical protein
MCGRAQATDNTRRSYQPAPAGRRAEGPERVAFSWLLALLVASLAIYPALVYPIEEHAYDAAVFHVYRGVVYSAARADGWLYPRWVQPVNAGLGSPLFSFYSPLLYALMDLLNCLGVAHPLAWRLIVALALLALAGGAFALALALFRRADVALLSVAGCTYAPYVLQEFFERGSPQGVAIALYPWLLWLLLRLVERPSGLRLALAGLCWAAIILLHNVAALLFLPVLAVFGAFLACRAGVRSLRVYAAALAVGVLLAAFYILPFLAERGYVSLEKASQAEYARPANNPLALGDLLSPPPILDMGFGNNSLGQRVGALQALALVLGPPTAVALWRGKRRAEGVLAGGLSTCGLVTIGLQLPLANCVWAALPALDILQFRWRLLSLIGLLTALILGYALMHWAQRCRGAIVAGLVLLTVGAQLPSLYPQLLPQYADFPPSPDAADAQAFALQAGVPGLTTFGELTPRWREDPFTIQEARRAAAMPIANLPPGARVVDAERRSGAWRVHVESPVAFDAAFHTLYFPGWAGYVDGQKQPLRPMEGTGLAVLNLPAGEHAVDLCYEGTSVQRWSEWLSGLTLLALLALAVAWRGRGVAVVDTTIYLQPLWWLAAGVVALVALKGLWVDRQTTWLRRSSDSTAVWGAQVPADVWFGDIHLCGYTISRSPLYPPGVLRATFYWQIDRPLEERAVSFVHLVGTRFDPATGYTMWDQQDKEAPAGFPVTRWVPGKIYEDTYELRIPAGQSPAEYQLEIGWWQPASGERLQPSIAQPSSTLAVSRAGSLLAFEHAFRPPDLQHPLQATLGQEVRLLGYRLEPAQPRPGEAVRLTLCWQALAEMQTSYTVFTHLLDEAGQMLGGHDGIPVYGARPTDRWLANEVQIDEHEYVLPAEAGRYTFEVGMYDAATGARLPAYDASGRRLEHDRVLLEPIIVE